MTTSTNHEVAPHRLARLVLLALTWAFGVISGSLGLNALIKSNQSKSYVKKNAPSGVTVSINTNDIFQVGVVLTVACTLLAILASLFFPLTFVPRKLFGIPTARGLRIQAYLLAFTTLWVFASLIPFDIFARNRSAKVTATLGKLTLPDSVVAQQEAMLGVSPVYWKQNYVRWQAIITWFAVLFGALASIVLFMASRRTTSSTHSNLDSSSDRELREKEADVRTSGATATA
ncbi:hypothetical protein BD410DRAFT_795718 [Rickenella mellea]|uniref:MARVEL domain-containing protein n=1 Tax=Rickenella mellea TaxID=50990 RepID=A0A4Y7PLT8_9AGAM|nr:hypothetical protein BD410DRAFT_795718 [Rickenella mellea]